MFLAFHLAFKVKNIGKIAKASKQQVLDAWSNQLRSSKQLQSDSQDIIIQISLVLHKTLLK